MSIAVLFALILRLACTVVLATCGASAQQSATGALEPNQTSVTPKGDPSPSSPASTSPTPTPAHSPSTTTTLARGISSFCPSGPFSSPLPQNPAVTTLNSNGPHYDHFDGPVWLPQLSKIYFSAWNNLPDTGIGPLSSITTLTPSGDFNLVSESGNFGTNGLALDGNGCIVAAAHDRQQIARFCSGHPNTRVALASTYGGLPFNSPNDAAVRSDGNIYFTDPDYQKDNRQGQAQTRIYRIAPNGLVSVVDATRNEPNGIALSLDENALFVGGNDNMILRYPINADGSTGTGQPWINVGNNCDGMVIDCAGNLYVSVYSENRVGVWNAAGQSVGSIPVGDNVTNLAFGDSDHMTLYITTVSGVQSVRLLVPGLPH